MLLITFDTQIDSLCRQEQNKEKDTVSLICLRTIFQNYSAYLKITHILFNRLLVVFLLLILLVLIPQKNYFNYVF